MGPLKLLSVAGPRMQGAGARHLAERLRGIRPVTTPAKARTIGEPRPSSLADLEAGEAMTNGGRSA